MWRGALRHAIPPVPLVLPHVAWGSKACYSSVAPVLPRVAWCGKAYLSSWPHQEQM